LRYLLERLYSLENKFANHLWADWLTEDDRKMRLEWAFTPSTWLVYPNFSRRNNLVPYFNPKELWPDTKFYWAVDFWWEHPLAFAFIAVDIDNNIYIFDLIYQSHLFLSDLAKTINQKKVQYWIEFEYIVADSAAKRERVELQKEWIKTVWADKFSKWENNESNRKAWISKLNQLLANQKILIADHLTDAIKEFEVHHYKEWGKKDAEVEKTEDDFLDRIRYFIFSYKPPKYKTLNERQLKKIGWQTWNDRYLKKNQQV
jgi:hypothetical protein